MNSISLPKIGLFRFTISYFYFGDLHFSRNLFDVNGIKLFKIYPLSSFYICRMCSDVFLSLSYQYFVFFFLSQVYQRLLILLTFSKELTSSFDFSIVCFISILLTSAFMLISFLILILEEVFYSFLNMKAEITDIIPFLFSNLVF